MEREKSDGMIQQHGLQKQGEDREPVMEQLMQLIQKIGVEIHRDPYYCQESGGESAGGGLQGLYGEGAPSIVVEVLIAVAERGGVENVIKMMLDESGDLAQLSRILHTVEQQGYVVPDTGYCRQKVLQYHRETALRKMAERMVDLLVH